MIIKAKNNELPPKRKGKWALALLFVCALICAVYPHYPIALKPPYFDYTPLLYFLLPTGIGLALLLWLWRTEHFAWVLAFSYIIVVVLTLAWFVIQFLQQGNRRCSSLDEYGMICQEYPLQRESDVLWIYYENISNLPLMRFTHAVSDGVMRERLSTNSQTSP